MKTAQLQVRVSVEQKRLLRQLARAAGQDLTTYVLARTVPDAAVRFQRALASLARADEGHFALAEIGMVLQRTSAGALKRVAGVGLPEGLTPLQRNLVAAMVEHVAMLRGTLPPAWTGTVSPLPEPWFATDMKRLRTHLLLTSPAAYRRRNIFVDATAMDHV